ncbi:MAG: nuclear transport factor 2 family protein [Candidatus Binataceae bacterium]|nr:nuclear transport factor 2 family protein [Candidatus Binataceae bacterium]
MSPSDNKTAVLRFLENLNHPDPAVFEELIAEDFSFGIVSAMTDFPPIRGRRNFATSESAILRQLFPSGLNLKIETVICEGVQVVALGEADTIANNGRRYHQRYSFYFRFEGDRIAEGREYNDTDLIRRVFLT